MRLRPTAAHNERLNEQARQVAAGDAADRQAGVAAHERVAVPEPSEKALSYHRSGNILWAVGLLWSVIVPVAFLWTGFSARIRVIAYNTKLVKPEEAPRSVFELADMKWREQVAIADPRFGSTSFHVAALYALAGDQKMDDFFRRLKANGVRIVDGNSVVRDLVVRGEVKLGLTDTDDVNVALEEGHEP